MNNRFLSFIILAALITQPVMAQTLIPATSEDINEFDKQVSEQLKRSGAKKDNFGQQVSEEAKKLKDSTTDQGKDFGKWVSGQRKKADQGRPSAEGGIGAGRSTAPGQTGVQPGKGKNKNK